MEISQGSQELQPRPAGASMSALLNAEKVIFVNLALEAGCSSLATRENISMR